MNEVKNFHLTLTSVEETAYKLFKDLKDEITTKKNDFELMEDRDRQQYLLELFRACLEAVKNQRFCAPTIAPQKI